MWWKPSDEIIVTDDDFVSLDDSQLSLPRQSDGSLPNIDFLTLAEGSNLIDAGIDVGIPFFGAAPDIGYAEYNPTLSIENPIFINDAVIQYYPNPTKDKVTIYSETQFTQPLTLKLINTSGQILFSKEIKANAMLNFDINLQAYSNGLYFLVINTNSKDYISSLKLVKY